VQLALETEGFEPRRVEISVEEILEEVELCSMATCSAEKPHAATMWFVFDGSSTLYVLTDPATRHCCQIEENSSVSLTVYSTEQKFSDRKRGLQLHGNAERIPDPESDEALELYSRKFPGATEFAESASDVEELESSFYRIDLDRVKVFDEPRFGRETWIEAEFSR
jgi:uncharacterized protein YhbP (UPF0306 family)